ncbi:MAG: hypothetical protein LBU43_11060, partial [Candidatus Accumulibacter sp.]|nr:hypothetical protein [Accumulibacter sp.]
LQKDRKLHKSCPCEQPLANLLIVNDYLQQSTTMAFMRLPWANPVLADEFIDLVLHYPYSQEGDGCRWTLAERPSGQCAGKSP